MRHARDRIRQLTLRSRLRLSVKAVVREINLFLHGWVGYFKYGHSAHRFDVIRDYAIERLAIFVGKRHKRGRRYGLSVVAYLSPDQWA
jgi:RNA-directed DNA polymerase